jgi:hypothetical protein
MKKIEGILAPLASLKVQDRFIVHGNKDEYLVPEELLESAINFLFEQQIITYQNTEIMQRLKENIRNVEIPSGISNRELVYEYGPWIRIREDAQLILEELGFDLANWEINEL